MRNQFAILGLFMILVGILIFIYWILLPVSEKEKILEEIYEKKNISQERSTYEIPERYLRGNVIENIYLYSGRKEILIAENYYLGELISFYEMNFESFSIRTNIFSGVKSKKLTFSYYEGEGIALSFVSKCHNGKIEIFINNVLIFEGCPNDLLNFFVQKEYLNKDINFLIFRFYPKSLFSDAIFEIRNLKILFVKRSELTFDYFYKQNENVFLIYNFCPTDPNSVELYINENRVPLYSCVHNSFDITKYLNSGKNIIKFSSKVRTQIDLKIQTSSNIFMQIFNLTKKDYMLYVTKNRGSGEIYINTCKFYLEPYKEVSSFFVSEKCVNNGENIIIIKPETFLEISNLLII
ncbi:MAG: hypothetical protein QW714_01925 [Nanopusillaceae archaeon]